MNYRFLVFSGIGVWGKHAITKDYFVAAAKRGDLIIDTQENTYFDADSNSWKAIEGDEA